MTLFNLTGTQSSKYIDTDRKKNITGTRYHFKVELHFLHNQSVHQKIQFDYGEHKQTIQINRPQQFVRKTFRLPFPTQTGSKYEKAQGKYSAKRKHKEEIHHAIS